MEVTPEAPTQVGVQEATGSAYEELSGTKASVPEESPGAQPSAKKNRTPRKKDVHGAERGESADATAAPLEGTASRKRASTAGSEKEETREKKSKAAVGETPEESSPPLDPALASLLNKAAVRKLIKSMAVDKKISASVLPAVSKVFVVDQVRKLAEKLKPKGNEPQRKTLFARDFDQ
jgi:histone H3/H4